MIPVHYPRWIGSKYFESSPRIMVLMTNPGAGEGTARQEANLKHLQLLRSFRDGSAGLQAVLDFQRQDMSFWGGRRAYDHFYTSQFGLEMDRVALLNIAWCPT